MMDKQQNKTNAQQVKNKTKLLHKAVNMALNLLARLTHST